MSMQQAAFVLASGSAGRRMVLKNAGLTFEVMPAAVDEEAIRQQFPQRGEADFTALALALADAKALEVSRRSPLPVLGGDQLLVLDGEVFGKPRDMQEARAHLQRLRGRTHHLISALSVAQGGEVVWQHVDSAAMTMRAFTDAFLDAYLRDLGEKALTSVGCYQVEGPGIQLFEKIKGDHFTIIGLPLLPFLAWLRQRGLLLA